MNTAIDWEAFDIHAQKGRSKTIWFRAGRLQSKSSFYPKCLAGVNVEKKSANKK